MAGRLRTLRFAQARRVDVEKQLAGCRVLRLLATGARSQVWLAPDERALKVLAPGDPQRVTAEVLALHRASGEHVVRLLDVSIDDDATVLVFPRLPRGSLAHLLSIRAGLDAGEAVTALAPIADCLARMHRAGVAHRAVTADAVLFRDDGAPMLTGFGEAVCFEPGLPEIALEHVDGVIDDRNALLALVAAVLNRVTGPRAPAAAALASRVGDFGTVEVETRLARELFDLAAARPIRFEPDDAPANVQRVVGVSQVAEPPLEPPTSDRRAAALFVRVVESGVGRVVRGYASTVWQRWSPHRRRLTIGLAVAAAVLIVAVTAVPSPDPDVEDTVASGVPPAEAPTDAPGVVETEITGDDPVAALAPLLERRTDCFRDLSMLCLDDVDERGSAALDRDRAALDALLQHGQQPAILPVAGAELVERLGDSALIALAPGTNPASLLLLKGASGWRIRDYLAKPSSEPEN